ELEDRLGMRRRFGERHLANADLEPAFAPDRLRAVERTVQRREPLTQRLGEIVDHEILEVTAISQCQPLFDRTVRDELANRGFESFGEMQHGPRLRGANAPL